MHNLLVQVRLQKRYQALRTEQDIKILDWGPLDGEGAQTYAKLREPTSR